MGAYTQHRINETAKESIKSSDIPKFQKLFKIINKKFASHEEALRFIGIATEVVTKLNRGSLRVYHARKLVEAYNKVKGWNNKERGNPVGKKGFKEDTKGYSFENGKYRAYIHIDRKQVYLGRFDTEEEASQAYQKAKQEVIDGRFRSRI